MQETTFMHTRPLLALDQTRGPVNAHNQVASHLGVQGAAVPRLLAPQNALDPRHHLGSTGNMLLTIGIELSTDLNYWHEFNYWHELSTDLL